MIPFTSEERPVIAGLCATAETGIREVLLLRKALGGSLSGVSSPLPSGLAQSIPWRRGLSETLQQVDFLSRGHLELANSAEHKLETRFYGDVDYPFALTILANPPAIFWIRGQLAEPPPRRVALVGSRSPTRYGLRQSADFARWFSEQGIQVVSGLARGIDGAAHQAALAGPGGTLAILGSGLLEIYPAEHRKLADDVAQNGCVLSEFAPTAPPVPHHFPRRNRLIAAFSDVLLVIEARQKSGALITARWALDLGKTVCGLPGQVDNPSAEGVLSLLRDGAVLVRTPIDLAEDAGWGELFTQDLSRRSTLAEDVGSISESESQILAQLDHEVRPLDELLANLMRPPGEVMTLLLSLEMRGLVTQESGLMFRRT